MHAIWNSNRRLVDLTRWPRPLAKDQSIDKSEIAILLGLGVLAAIATNLSFNVIRLPGHAIMRGTLPLILGISLVPRRTSGSTMSLAAMLTFAAMWLGGRLGTQPAAQAGLITLGPALDLALWHARSGWKLYTRFALAGLAANLIAFVVRLAAALVGAEPLRSRGIFNFWPMALFSFVLFGAVAGLVSGIIWFRLTPRNKRTDVK